MLSKQGKVGQLKMIKLIPTTDSTGDYHNFSRKSKNKNLVLFFQRLKLCGWTLVFRNMCLILCLRRDVALELAIMQNGGG